MQTLEESKNKMFKVLVVLVVILSAYIAVLIFSEIKKDSMLGESTVPATISFSGHGEVTAVPDIANINFNISKDAKTAKEAQAAVAVIEKKVLDFLKTNNVADKDIQTANASLYPKYEYGSTNQICPLNGYCPPPKQVIVGYTAFESINIKVRNTDDVGKIMQQLGTLGVSELNGPNFAIDKEDALKAEARKKAIDDAREKAKVLAKDLGVKLVRISSFSESGGGFPMMYEKAMSADSGVPLGAPAQLPKGENTISSDVTITYEIR